MANNSAAVAKLCIKYITLNKSYPLKWLREEMHVCKLFGHYGNTQVRKVLFRYDRPPITWHVSISFNKLKWKNMHQ